MSRGSAWAWAFVAACVVAGGWAFSRLAASAGAGGAEVPPGSARRYDPHGTAALAQTFRRLDVPVRYLERPRLEAGARGVLIRLPGVPERDGLFEGSDEAAAVYDLPAAALLEWVAEGNVLVSAGRGERGISETLGFGVAVDAEAVALERAQRAGRPPDELEAEPVEAELDLAGLVPDAAPRRLALRAPATFEADPERPFAAEAVDAGGRVLAAALRHGDGLVVLVGSPDPFQTANLRAGDHLAFALDLLAAGPEGTTVWFDEWAHGLGHAGSLVEVLIALGLVPLGLQAGGWLLAYGWSRRGRRALPPAPEEPAAGGAVAQAEALGRLVRANTAPADAAAGVAAEVRLRFARVLRCPPPAVEARLGETPAAQAARAVLAAAERDAGRGVPRCRRCRFPLRGDAATAACPECGEPLDARQRRTLAAPAVLDATPPGPGAEPPAGWAALADRLHASAEAAAALAAETGRPGARARVEGPPAGPGARP